jgi:hypothetical protein
MNQSFFRKLKTKAAKLLIWAGVPVIIVVALLFGVRTISFAPDNALVLKNEVEKTYLSPLLIVLDEREFLVVSPLILARQNDLKPATTEIEALSENLKLNDEIYVDLKRGVYYLLPHEGFINLYRSTIGEAEEEGYTPDERHRDWGGFIDECGFIDNIRSILGIRKGRWTEDGDWRW